MAKILVTGAAGFIGSHTVDLLLAQGHTVCGLDNFRTGKAANLAAAMAQNAFQFIELDCAVPGNLAKSVQIFAPDAIIHLAAMVSVPESIANPAENDRLNLQATRLAAEAALAHGVKRIVFASSAAVYGANLQLPLDETADCHPLSPYGTAKLNSERLLMDLSRAHGITVRCQRYFNVYGPRQDPSSPYSGVISLFRHQLTKDLPVTIHGDGEQTRDFIHVGDVALANTIAATTASVQSGIANICTGRAASLNVLYSTLGRLLGKTASPVHAPVRDGDIRQSRGSPTKAKIDLDFTAQTLLEDGLRTL
jgi:UDP-glucose 4-epimerase